MNTISNISTTPYNLKNQKPNSEKLIDVMSFSSENFGGFLTANPITIENNQIKINPSTIIGAGMLFDIGGTPEGSPITFSNNNNLLYLKITLKANGISYLDNNTISGIDPNIIHFEECTCSSISLENKKYNYSPVTIFRPGDTPVSCGYYEYNPTTKVFTLSSDDQFLNKTYYFLHDDSMLKFTSSDLQPAGTYSYNGEIIWLYNDVNNKSFIIPLCAKINNELTLVSKIKTLSDFKESLSSENYAQLKNYIENTFVWKAGGANIGNIGNLNITENVISNINPQNTVTINNPKLNISNVTNSLSDANFVIKASDGKTVISNSDTLLPINRGGTGGATKILAKNNLGIYWGENLPNASAFEEGDIFFQIIE